MAVPGLSCCVPASSTPHDGTTARKVRENPNLNATQHLRRAAARTIPKLWDAIRDALPAFNPDECANYFTATGYEPE